MKKKVLAMISLCALILCGCGKDTENTTSGAGLPDINDVVATSENQPQTETTEKTSGTESSEKASTESPKINIDMKYYKIGELKYGIPSGWEGDGKLDEEGTATFYVKYGMLTIDQMSADGEKLPDFKDDYIHSLNVGFLGGKLAEEKSFQIDGCDAVIASGNCMVGESEYYMSVLLLQVEDTLYQFMMGSDEGHHDDYINETAAIFSSVTVNK